MPGSVSPDGRLLAWAADTTGRRFYTIHFKDLETGEVLPDVIPAVTSNLACTNDSRTLFYSKQDPLTLRSDRVYRHTLGADTRLLRFVYESPTTTYDYDMATRERTLLKQDTVLGGFDDSIPLTTGEYDEWGNPNLREYYDYILSYSPYDNVEAKDYPHLLVTTGLHDSQVQYWEPAKWVAKLRALKTDRNRLLLHTNMEDGHGGASGRFERYRETARNYAFLLDLAGKADPAPASSR